MSGFFQQARTALSQELQKFRNRSFLEATMAASALVASVDGEINIAELSMLDQALEAINELKIYDPHVAIDLYREHAEALTADPGAAREKILRLVRKLSDDKHAARLLIKVCVAIGKSDDDFTESEKATIDQLCANMGLDPAETGL
ncbi:MAG: tellurite resistance TerB family protein [Alphaproteobacteria bacterium]|jgi:tellurite resistance protein TerB